MRNEELTTTDERLKSKKDGGTTIPHSSFQIPACPGWVFHFGNIVNRPFLSFVIGYWVLDIGYSFFSHIDNLVSMYAH